MPVIRVVALSIAVCVVASPGSAQSVMGELQRGAAVRVRADGADAGRVKGTLLASSPDSLVLMSGQREISVARRDVRSLEVKRRRTRSAGALRLAAWVGGLTAAVFTPLYLGVEEYSCGSDQCRDEGGDIAQIAAVGFSGSIYGQVIGAIWPGRQWLPVPPDAPSSGSLRPPASGRLVRVSAPGYTAPALEGTVTNSTPDSLVLLARGGTVIAVPMAAVTGIEYASGRNRGAGALRGLMQAAPVAGLYLSMAWMESSVKSYRNGSLQHSDSDFTAAMLGGAVFSAVVGAGLGAAIAPRQWSEPRASTSLLVSPDARGRAMRVGLVRRF